jgi:hypothetical protein
MDGNQRCLKTGSVEIGVLVLVLGAWYGGCKWLVGKELARSSIGQPSNPRAQSRNLPSVFDIARRLGDSLLYSQALVAWTWEFMCTI